MDCGRKVLGTFREVIVIVLDGSMGEGGGQILRTSLALSLITKKPFHLRRIRAKRAKPGLQPQHLMSVQAATVIGQARVRGASPGSMELVFEPGETVPGNYHFRIGTAGAAGLVMHTVYLPLALASGPSVVTIEGGTHVKSSPCFDFLRTTWQGYMAQLGLFVDLRMARPGFFPRGGGLIEARLPGGWQPRNLRLADVSTVDQAVIISAVAGLPESIARRQADRALERLRTANLQATIRYETWTGGPGTMLAVELATRPVPTLFFSLGERGKPAERVADEAVDQAVVFLGTRPQGIDGHSADQIVLPMALAHEESQFKVAEITRHLLTNAQVIEQFLDKQITCEGSEGSPGWAKLS
jgi:RNA 3'-terminal phosphate cyclase (ATP)